MPVSFEKVTLGGSYDRPTLAALWGYKTWRAIGKGIFTPASQNLIVIFITKEKQEALPQYEDILDGDFLRMEGEESHRSDDRLIRAHADGDEVHLFYRERHHSHFTYRGQVKLESFERASSQPSRFMFRLAPPGE